jgi:hypothetical protein
MHAAKIVVGKMQGARSLQVRQLLTESVGQARESANRHSHGQVLPFHKTSRDVVRIGVASSDFGYNLHDRTWGVPRIGVMLTVVAEQLHQLREIHIQSECFGNALCVMAQAVCSDLRPPLDAVIQIPEERSRIEKVTFANVE